MPETVTPPTTLTDVGDQAAFNDAAAKIEGLLDIKGSVLPDDSSVEDDGPDESAHADSTESDESPEPQDDDGEESDTADQETDPSGDDADQSEETESPIAAPASWNADEKKLFATLPPEVQSTIARREFERDQATDRGMRQIAEQRKAIESQVAQASQSANQYANTLNQLLTLTIPEIQQIEQTDWMRLSQNPSEYIRLAALRDNLRSRVNFMQGEMTKAQQQQQQHLVQAHQEHLAQQYDLMVRDIPEMRDYSKANALVTDITHTMTSYGFDPSEIGAVADARVVKVMARLTQLEKAEAARKSAMTKRGTTPAPKVMPTTSPPEREDSRKKQVEQQFAKLRRTGSPQDAAKLLETIL